MKAAYLARLLCQDIQGQLMGWAKEVWPQADGQVPSRHLAHAHVPADAAEQRQQVPQQEQVGVW